MLLLAFWGAQAAQTVIAAQIISGQELVQGLLLSQPLMELTGYIRPAPDAAALRLPPVIAVNTTLTGAEGSIALLDTGRNEASAVPIYVAAHVSLLLQDLPVTNAVKAMVDPETGQQYSVCVGLRLARCVCKRVC